MDSSENRNDVKVDASAALPTQKSIIRTFPPSIAFVTWLRTLLQCHARKSRNPDSYVGWVEVMKPNVSQGFDALRLAFLRCPLGYTQPTMEWVLQRFCRKSDDSIAIGRGSIDYFRH